MNAPNRVIERDANWLQGVGRDGEIVAAARRSPRARSGTSHCASI